MCRLHYETPGETGDFAQALARLIPGGAVPSVDLPATEPDQPSAPESRSESLYRRTLAVWTHPIVVDAVRADAHRFLLGYLATGRASASFVASVCDEAMLILGRDRNGPEESGR